MNMYQRDLCLSRNRHRGATSRTEYVTPVDMVREEVHFPSSIQQYLKQGVRGPFRQVYD